jgi:hypothetical protein
VQKRAVRGPKERSHGKYRGPMRAQFDLQQSGTSP